MFVLLQRAEDVVKRGSYSRDSGGVMCLFFVRGSLGDKGPRSQLLRKLDVDGSR